MLTLLESIVSWLLKCPTVFSKRDTWRSDCEVAVDIYQINTMPNHYSVLLCCASYTKTKQQQQKTCHTNKFLFTDSVQISHRGIHFMMRNTVWFIHLFSSNKVSSLYHRNPSKGILFNIYLVEQPKLIPFKPSKLLIY